MIRIFGYTFPDSKACIVCEHVYSAEREINIAVHDHDGWLQFLCGDKDHKPEYSKIVSIDELFKRHDATRLPNLLKYGQYAEINNYCEWVIRNIDDT